MPNKLPSVTIGIPAYNEEKNIVSLLESLLKQKTDNCVVTKIIVASDGSSDQTVNLIKKLHSPLIEVIDNQDRKGQAFRQNQIVSLTDTNILVLLNADVIIKQSDFIAEIVRPVIEDRKDLVSTHITALHDNSFLAKTLSFSLEIKNFMFENYQNGINVFSCHGAARAFSQRMYRQLKFETSIGEDAFSYLHCQKLGFSYAFTKKATVFIQSPNTFNDHRNQSVRFLQTKKKLAEYFTEKAINDAYFLPISIKLKALVLFIVKHPVHALDYTRLLLQSWVWSYARNFTSETWQVSESSKSSLAMKKE